MIYITKESFLRRKAKGVFLKLFDIIDNNNNPDTTKNGEEKFLDYLFSKFTNQTCLIFDVGANVGKYALYLTEACQKKSITYTIHAFEPTKKAFEEFTKKLGNDSKVIKNNFGVSNSNETAVIYSNIEGSAFSSLYQRDLSQNNISFDKEETITLKRLDDYITTNAITHIDFLKIDIEGHELKAFEGMGKYLNNEFISVIQFEYGGANADSRTYLKDFYSLLEGKGYDLYKIKPGSLELRKYSPSMENFRYANYVAISKNDHLQ